ncbi:MAG: hypothetical protein M0C28_06325 [Candidatus Moduliflexus flocculans]|nr:hypothetical protein [Candidatus Moduliflexus flocculans]
MTLSPAVSSERFLVHVRLGDREPALASPFSPKYPGGGATGPHRRSPRHEGRGGRPLAGLRGRRPRSRRRPGTGPAGTGPDGRVPCRTSTRGSSCRQRSSSRSPKTAKTYETVAKVANDVSPQRGRDGRSRNSRPSFEARPARFVRVLASSVGTVPDWHYGAGGKAWLFADEIIVE